MYKKGEVQYVYKKDGSQFTIKVELSMISHNIVTVQGKAATCTEEGTTNGRKCLVCGFVKEEQKTIPIIDHEYSVQTWK